MLASDLSSEVTNLIPDVQQSGGNTAIVPKRSPRRKTRLGALSMPNDFSDDTELMSAIGTWRKKDNRIWSDEEVLEFPNTFFYNLHREEWKSKEKMAQNLRSYLLTEGKSNYTALDVGCDCGWFSDMLSEGTSGNVLGIDLDISRVDQANKLFNKPNLSFRRGNFFTTRLRKNSFDHIILMDTHKWMPSLEQVVERSRYLLAAGGELHILNSSLPTVRSLKKAQDGYVEYCSDKLMSPILSHVGWTTKEDFINLGFEEMKTSSLRSRLFGKKQTGAWMRLRAGRQ